MNIPNRSPNWALPLGARFNPSIRLVRSMRFILLVAAVFGGLLIVVNPGSAQTWTLTSAPIASWKAVASSADGTKLVAAIQGGSICTSTNSGAAWTRTSAPNLGWKSVASSADGTKLVAAVHGSYGGSSIYTSTDSRGTWQVTSAPGTNLWTSVASSADGSKLVAGGTFVIGRNYVPVGGDIFASPDSGVTWKSAGLSGGNWTSVASSSDGGRLVAAVHGGYRGNAIYSSTDSGATWKPTGAPSENWSSVASSADGTKLAASGGEVPSTNGPIYSSTNSGKTW